MGYLIKMAFRNIGRNKRRTLLSLVAVAVGVTFVIFARGFILGMVETLLANVIRFNSGHVRIVNVDYGLKEMLLPLTYPVDGFSGEGYQSMVNELGNVPGVKVAGGRIRFGLLLAKGERTEPGLGVGVRPTSEEQISTLSRYIGEGRFIRPGEKEIVVGATLMKEMDLSVGDSVTVVANSSFNSLKGVTFKIVGSLETGLQLLDRSSYMPLNLAQRMLEMEGQVTELIVMAQDKGQTAAVLKDIQEQFDSKGAGDRYDIRPWYSLNDLVVLMGMAKQIYNVIYILILFLACFVMLNTMTMVISERTREIGMMGALGLGRGEILGLLLLEGFVLGILGSAIGVVVGGGGLYALSITGIDFSQNLSGLDEEFLLTPTLFPFFSLGNLIFGFFLGIVIAMLTSLFPARRATSLDPTEALRHV